MNPCYSKPFSLQYNKLICLIIIYKGLQVGGPQAGLGDANLAKPFCWEVSEPAWSDTLGNSKEIWKYLNLHRNPACPSLQEQSIEILMLGYNIGRLDVKSIAMLVKITFYFKVTAVPKKLQVTVQSFLPAACWSSPKSTPWIPKLLSYILLEWILTSWFMFCVSFWGGNFHLLFAQQKYFA